MPRHDLLVHEAGEKTVVVRGNIFRNFFVRVTGRVRTITYTGFIVGIVTKFERNIEKIRRKLRFLFGGFVAR